MNGILTEDDTIGFSLTEFDEAVPGEWLGLILEAVDIRGLNGHQLVEFVAAAQRQKAHLDALALQAAHELAYCPPGDEDAPPSRTELPGDRAVGVLEMHCGWTRYKAGQYVALAMDLGSDLPETLKALDAGEIEADTARVISERTEAVKDPLDRRKVEAKVLAYVRDSIAKGLRRTTSQVRDKVNREVLRVEPEAVKKRHTKRVEERGVGIRADQDCTACLSLYNLPADQAAQANARIDALARAAKNAGDPQDRTLAQLRADIAVSLLDGTGRVSDTSTNGTSTNETAWSDPRAGGRIMLVTTMAEIAGQAEGTSTLGWVGPICSEIARRLALNHLNNPRMEYDVVITDPQTGRVRQIHPLSRLFTGRLRTMVEIDKPWCEWPTCTRSSLDCEIDHILEHAKGGATEFGNGGPKCDRGHHRDKSVNGWTDHVEPNPEDPSNPDHELVSPHGHHYPIQPQPLTEPQPPPPDEPPF